MIGCAGIVCIGERVAGSPSVRSQTEIALISIPASEEIL